MASIKIIQKQNTTVLRCPLSGAAAVNQVEWDTIRKGDLPELLAVSFTSSFFGKALECTVAALPTLSAYLSSGISVSRFFQAAEQIADIMHRCESAGIRLSNLELNPAATFYDPFRNQIRMVYWPMLSLEPPVVPADYFMRLEQFFLCPPQDSAWMARYHTLLDPHHPRSLSELSTAFRALRQEWEGSARKPALALPPAAMHRAASAETSACLLRSSTGERISLNRFPFTLGRKPESCHYAIPQNRYISQKHLTIFKEPTGYFIRDLYSANGTLLDGIALIPGQDTPLPSGAVLNLGGEEIIFLTESEHHQEST